MALALFAATVPGAVVVRPVANMYSHPTEDADVVSQTIFGSNISILEEQGSWARIRTPDQYTGWISTAVLRRLGALEKPYASSGKIAQVESLFASLYREPNITTHAPVFTVPYETRLEVIAEPPDNQRWLQVRLPDDRSAWVQRGDIAINPRLLSVDEMLALSKRFVGLPYLWGGVSTFGFDCSGFTQMLCRRRGVLLPRDAGPQSAWEGVVPVKPDALAPGDLLYFGSSPTHITHTGLYLGDGQFINATAWLKPVVQVCDLHDPHWSSLLVACRRIK